VIHDLFPGIFPAALHLEVMQNYLRDQIDCFTLVWHVLRRREPKTSGAESFEMLTALFLQQMEHSLGACRSLVITNFKHCIG
jgi:hypothetical protein